MPRQSNKSISLVPPEAIQMSVKAFNASDLSGMLTYFAENAEFRLIGFPSGQPDSLKGKKQLRAWFKELAAQHLQIEVEVLETEGGLIKTKTLIWSDLTRQLGVAPLVATDQYLVENGKIKSAERRIHPESAAKLQAALSHIQK